MLRLERKKSKFCGIPRRYLPLLYAHLIAGEHGRVASVVTAAGEVGSGTAPAATGKVFAAIVRAGGLPRGMAFRLL